MRRTEHALAHRNTYQRSLRSRTKSKPCSVLAHRNAARQEHRSHQQRSPQSQGCARHLTGGTARSRACADCVRHVVQPSRHPAVRASLDRSAPGTVAAGTEYRSPCTWLGQHLRSTRPGRAPQPANARGRGTTGRQIKPAGRNSPAGILRVLVGA